MLILDGLLSLDNDRLRVPLYHRGHLSLKTDTKITLALIPPKQKASSPQLMEMVVSPIEYKSWSSLWRIEASFLESPGIVNKLFTIIANEGFNVLNEESSSTENRDTHTIELVIDTQEHDNFADDYIEYKRMEGSATRNTSKVPTRIVETNGGMKWQGKANGA